MSSSKEFSPPYSGHDLVLKIIHAYALCGDGEVTLDSVASKAGMDRTQVSKNNGFLVSVGIIEGGNKKKTTDLGRELGIAISHGDNESAAKTWKTLISEVSSLTSIVDMVKVQGGIKAEILPAKVAMNLGMPGGKSQTLTASHCLIEILKDAGLLKEEGERITANSVPGNVAVEDDLAARNGIRSKQIDKILMKKTTEDTVRLIRGGVVQFLWCQSTLTSNCTCLHPLNNRSTMQYSKAFARI